MEEPCPLCLEKGIKSSVIFWQCTLNEAILGCENVKCPFPFDENYRDVKWKRNYRDIDQERCPKVKIADITLKNAKTIKGHFKLCKLSTNAGPVQSLVQPTPVPQSPVPLQPRSSNRGEHKSTVVEKRSSFIGDANFCVDFNTLLDLSEETSEPLLSCNSQVEDKTEIESSFMVSTDVDLTEETIENLLHLDTDEETAAMEEYVNDFESDSDGISIINIESEEENTVDPKKVTNGNLLDETDKNSSISSCESEPLVSAVENIPCDTPVSSITNDNAAYLSDGTDENSQIVPLEKVACEEPIKEDNIKTFIVICKDTFPTFDTERLKEKGISMQILNPDSVTNPEELANMIEGTIYSTTNESAKTYNVLEDKVKIWLDDIQNEGSGKELEVEPASLFNYTVQNFVRKSQDNVAAKDGVASCEQGIEKDVAKDDGSEGICSNVSPPTEAIPCQTSTNLKRQRKSEKSSALQSRSETVPGSSSLAEKGCQSTSADVTSASLAFAPWTVADCSKGSHLQSSPAKKSKGSLEKLVNSNGKKIPKNKAQVDPSSYEISLKKAMDYTMRQYIPLGRKSTSKEALSLKQKLYQVKKTIIQSITSEVNHWRKSGPMSSGSNVEKKTKTTIPPCLPSIDLHSDLENSTASSMSKTCPSPVKSDENKSTFPDLKESISLPIIEPGPPADHPTITSKVAQLKVILPLATVPGDEKKLPLEEISVVKPTQESEISLNVSTSSEPLDDLDVPTDDVFVMECESSSSTPCESALLLSKTSLGKVPSKSSSESFWRNQTIELDDPSSLQTVSSLSNTSGDEGSIGHAVHQFYSPVTMVTLLGEHSSLESVSSVSTSSLVREACKAELTPSMLQNCTDAVFKIPSDCFTDVAETVVASIDSGSTLRDMQEVASSLPASGLAKKLARLKSSAKRGNSITPPGRSYRRGKSITPPRRSYRRGNSITPPRRTYRRKKSIPLRSKSKSVRPRKSQRFCSREHVLTKSPRLTKKRISLPAKSTIAKDCGFASHITENASKLPTESPTSSSTGSDALCSPVLRAIRKRTRQLLASELLKAQKSNDTVVEVPVKNTRLSVSGGGKSPTKNSAEGLSDQAQLSASGTGKSTAGASPGGISNQASVLPKKLAVRKLVYKNRGQDNNADTSARGQGNNVDCSARTVKADLDVAQTSSKCQILRKSPRPKRISVSEEKPVAGVRKLQPTSKSPSSHPNEKTSTPENVKQMASVRKSYRHKPTPPGSSKESCTPSLEDKILNGVSKRSESPKVPILKGNAVSSDIANSTSAKPCLNTLSAAAAISKPYVKLQRISFNDIQMNRNRVIASPTKSLRSNSSVEPIMEELIKNVNEKENLSKHVKQRKTKSKFAAKLFDHLSSTTSDNVTIISSQKMSTNSSDVKNRILPSKVKSCPSSSNNNLQSPNRLKSPSKRVNSRGGSSTSERRRVGGTAEKASILPPSGGKKMRPLKSELDDTVSKTVRKLVCTETNRTLTRSGAKANGQRSLRKQS